MIKMREAEYIDVSENIIEIHSFDTEKPDEKKIVYRINKDKKQIKFMPFEKFAVSEILIEGFGRLPLEFSDKGYIKSGLMYYLNKKLTEQNVAVFIISRLDRSRTRSIRGDRKLVLNYSDFSNLKKNITDISNEAKLSRSSFVNEFFYKLFPNLYKKAKSTSKKRAIKAIRNLQSDIIDDLTKQDIASFLDFFEVLLKTKYKSEISKRKLFNSAKIKIDNIAIQDIIKGFQEMIKLDPPESKWGTFLKQNLFLIDSKYIHFLSELNVVLASTRKADFGLIDAQGYLDIFEIKKPSTTLISKKQDRGNYYWSQDAIKAITQAEKYLHHAEKKASDLAEDIRSQRGYKVKIIKPRAYVIIGNSVELNNQNKKDDFRILRMSLKNVEIILYDELLERIKNQKNELDID